MTQIERRQARLRRIRTRNQMAGKPMDENVATTPEAHHCIGISQNHPENLFIFLQNHRGDPAIKVIIVFKYYKSPTHHSIVRILYRNSRITYFYALNALFKREPLTEMLTQ
jgi:hypothetical protein